MPRKDNQMKFSYLQDNDLELNGHVWIGDPCYIIRDNDWSKFLDVLWKDGGDYGVIHSPHGDILVFQTAYGDGVYSVYYKDQEVGDCGVDAGLLAIMPAETAFKIRRNKKEVTRLGVITNASGTAHADGAGNMEIGDLRVVTGGEE